MLQLRTVATNFSRTNKKIHWPHSPAIIHQQGHGEVSEITTEIDETSKSVYSPYSPVEFL